ncbi:centriolar coiled-coil protein of 110 kDa [Xenopus laevis]|uniref:Centriolar coiled-coil protein of 110 kDa n=2 Tax=Xenopus laevis TaxID=8355 RepID=A0A1L8EXP3_XENLA|nr:centriolar coiled-coil protein of 110 kDa [Xenopus laevis]OCT64111.1 hypothetical protein XELAEV_18045213mg [Xenopus laevis]
MEPYEEFCKKQLARIQVKEILHDDISVNKQRLSVIKFHGVAVLSPLLTAEKKQEMQQYRQRAIELNEKKQNCRKTSLLTRVQEILESVQVKKAPGVNVLTDSEAVDQMPSNKNLNGFTILPNVLSLPVFSAQHEPTKFEKSLENVLHSSESNSMDAIPVEKNSLPIKNSTSPTTEQTKDLSCEMSLSPPQSECETVSREAPDPYKMSLQNLLKKSREYIEREQSRRHLRNLSKGSVSESHSDKENDTIKISNSLKEKAKVLSRSRSCSPLMIEKPMLNKSNTLLQAASSQGQSLLSSSLSTLSNADLPVISGSSSLVESESDEELKCSFADCESNILKSLTGSYAKLPSPEPSLSPKMHRRRPRPLSAGNIVITYPVNAYDLSPKENVKAMEFPKMAEKTSFSDPVPKHDDYNAGLFPVKRHSLNTNNAAFVTNLTGLPGCIAADFGNMSGSANIRTDDQQTVVARGPRQMKATSTFGKVPDSSVLHQHTDPDTIIQHGIKTNCSPEMINHSSPVELNKSYDVETPSPILMQSQGSSQTTETPLGPCLREPFLENRSDVQIKRRLELDLDITPAVSGEQEKRWIHKQRNRSGSLQLSSTEISKGSLGDHFKKKMLAFEDMRKKLEEQHSYQLSLLIAEQEREQEKLKMEFEEEEKQLRLKDTDSPSRTLDNGSMIPDRNSRTESSVQERVDNCHSCSTYNSVGSVSATSLHSYSSTNESSLGLWGPVKSRAPSTSVSNSHGRAKTRWSQVYSPAMQRKFNKATALAKGFLTRRLMQTEKLNNLKKTVKDTAEFMRTFQSEFPLSRGMVSSQDASLQERVLAQLRAALYEIHDIFLAMEPAERMNILAHDRELRREKMIRNMEKVKSPRDRVTLSSATQKSLDRKKLTRVVHIGMSNKKLQSKPRASENRILQPNQGQNAPVHRLLSREGSIYKKNPKKEAKCCDNLRRQHSLG